MEYLTQQLATLSVNTMSDMKEYFRNVREQSDKIYKEIGRELDRNKPNVKVTSKEQAHSSTQEAITTNPVQSNTKSTLLEDPITVTRKANNLRQVPAEDPITVTRKASNLNQAQDPSHQQSTPRPTPRRSVVSDDVYENANYEVNPDEIETDYLPQPEPESPSIHRAKPPTADIDREIYSFDRENGVRADPNLSVADAESLLDLMSGMEGQKVPNGENLLITSNGKKLFETDAEGVITFSINQRESTFSQSPINNSLNVMKQNLNSFVQTQRRLKTDLKSGVKNTQPSSATETDSQSPVASTSPATSENPTELLNQAISNGDIQQTSGDNPIAEQEQTKAQSESLLSLRDQLKDGGVLTNSKSTITLENQSKGISNIKLTEPGQKPVSLGKVSKTGIVTLGTQYTNDRTATIENLLQNGRVEGVNHQQRSSATQTVTNGNVPINNNAPTKVNTPSKSNTSSNGNAGSQSSHNAYSYQDIKNLYNYYNSSTYKNSQSKPEEASKVTPQQATERLNEQKTQLLNSARQDIEQKGGLAEGRSLNSFNDDFFKNFQTEDVILSEQEQADLSSANELAASQTAKPLTQESNVHQETPTLTRGR
jgi:hypothetical protein